LCLPATGAYVGWLARGAHRAYRAATRPALAPLRLPGVLARLRAVDRLHLSPEGYAERDHRRLTEHLLRRGVRNFQLCLHSTSLEPGHTSYVRDEAELRELVGRCRSYFRYFLEELGGVATTPLELKRALEGEPTPAGSARMLRHPDAAPHRGPARTPTA
jgi:hypothetical protein